MKNTVLPLEYKRDSPIKSPYESLVEKWRCVRERFVSVPDTVRGALARVL